MAMLHFFCDESGKYQKNPVVSISGIAATRERSDPFNAEWRTLLRSYGLSQLHMNQVLDLKSSVGTKMVAGQALDERQELLFPFADCINKYMEIGLAQAWSVEGYAKIPMAAKRVLGGSNDPYQLAFVRGLMAMADYARPEDFVNVIVDDNVSTAWDTYLHYRNALKADSNRYEKFVGISFSKSFHYSPLQASDMVAFLARRAARRQFYKIANDCQLLTDYLFSKSNGALGAQSIMEWYLGFFDEDQMVALANEILGLSSAKNRR